jgi:hypothetical protein
VAIDLPFDRPLAPGITSGRSDSCIVATPSHRDPDELTDAGRLTTGEPGIQLVEWALDQEDMEGGEQVARLGDRGAVTGERDTSGMGKRCHDNWDEVYILDGELTDVTLGQTFRQGMYAYRPDAWSMDHGDRSVGR